MEWNSPNSSSLPEKSIHRSGSTCRETWIPERETKSPRTRRTRIEAHHLDWMITGSLLRRSALRSHSKQKPSTRPREKNDFQEIHSWQSVLSSSPLLSSSSIPFDSHRELSLPLIFSFFVFAVEHRNKSLGVPIEDIGHTGVAHYKPYELASSTKRYPRTQHNTQHNTSTQNQTTTTTNNNNKHNNKHDSFHKRERFVVALRTGAKKRRRTEKDPIPRKTREGIPTYRLRLRLHCYKTTRRENASSVRESTT